MGFSARCTSCSQVPATGTPYSRSPPIACGPVSQGRLFTSKPAGTAVLIAIIERKQGFL
jgi:hypothetical protein